MSADDPKWVSQSPDKWQTYWRACYQIANAKPVIVDEYCRTEKDAVKKADGALQEALADINKHGVTVVASSWTVKHQSRTQTRNFGIENFEEYITCDWYGMFRTVSKKVAEQKGKAHG